MIAPRCVCYTEMSVANHPLNELQHMFLNLTTKGQMVTTTKLLATALLASFAIGCSTFSSPSIEERLAAQQEKHEERMAQMQEEWKKERKELAEEKKKREELQQLQEEERRLARDRERQERHLFRWRLKEEYLADRNEQQARIDEDVYDWDICLFDGTDMEAPPWICDTGKFRDPNGAKFGFISMGVSSNGYGVPFNFRLNDAHLEARAMLADEVASFVGTKVEKSQQTTSDNTFDGYNMQYKEAEARETIKGAYKLAHVSDPTGLVYVLLAIPNEMNNVTRSKAQMINPSMRGNDTAMYQMFQHQKLKEGIANGRLAQPQLQNNQ